MIDDPRELDEPSALERVFYDALAREATGAATSSVPTADDLALVDMVLARHATATATGETFDALALEPERRPSNVRRLAVVLAVAAAVVLAVVTIGPELAQQRADGSSGELQIMTPDGAPVLEAGRRAPRGERATTQARDAAPLADEPTPPPTIAPSPEPKRHSERATKPTTDPATMLVQARARLGEGDEAGAAKVYAGLIDAHPSSAEAQAARVSLGQLRLATGRHKAALALFERYLQRGGPLTEEALWGRIQALAALGRREELATAVDRLVRELPRSVYRTRAQALVSKPAGGRP